MIFTHVEYMLGDSRGTEGVRSPPPLQSLERKTLIPAMGENPTGESLTGSSANEGSRTRYENECCIVYWRHDSPERRAFMFPRQARQIDYLPISCSWDAVVKTTHRFPQRTSQHRGIYLWNGCEADNKSVFMSAVRGLAGKHYSGGVVL